MEFKSTTHVVMVVFLMFLMFQCKVATSRRIGKGCALACNDHVHEAAGTAGSTRKPADMEDYGDGNGQGDYDYYRRYGDVPSPGIGH